jgi:hypothetical protein
VVPVVFQVSLAASELSGRSIESDTAAMNSRENERVVARRPEWAVTLEAVYKQPRAMTAKIIETFGTS